MHGSTVTAQRERGSERREQEHPVHITRIEMYEKNDAGLMCPQFEQKQKMFFEDLWVNVPDTDGRRLKDKVLQETSSGLHVS